MGYICPRRGPGFYKQEEILKGSKFLKETKSLNFLTAFSISVIAYICTGPLTSSKILMWTGCFFVSPFAYLVRPIDALTGLDSSSYTPFLWVVIFLYYALLFRFLFRFIKEEKYKVIVIFTTAYAILHEVSTYWFYLQMRWLFK